jgi:Ca-activated chloride channel family protein
VFLLDVSGSMNQPNKLPLVKSSMRMLVEKLGENDHVTIVTYAGTSGLVLPPTSGMNKKQILSAIQELKPGGSTNGAGGITLAYEQAESGFIKGGANRVILATDGDFNVGVTDQGQLTRLIEQKAKTGVFLSVLGFGMGNLKDSTMEKLADKGNGNYAYIDTPNEGRKVLVEQMTGTLVTVAKDVKIQVEFNPAVAASYRLIGYENRMLAKEDFNDDKKDAGEIGAGHTVTALYEIVPAGSKDVATAKVDDLKYQKSPPETEPVAPPASAELLTLKLRYKEPEGETSKLMEFPITDGGSTFDKASGDFKFTTAVAGFGMLLRNSPHKGDASFSSVLEWAEEGMGADASGYRQEFIDLVRKAKELKSDHPQINTDEHR